MIVAYSISEPDCRARMFEDDPQLKKCTGCGYRLDFFAHNPRFRLAGDKYDICATYDLQSIGSLAFKRFCEGQGYCGLRFLGFDSDEVHFHVVVEKMVPFDPVRRGTRFENLCNDCGNYESVAGATPAFLKVSTPLLDGIYRTDVLFGSGNHKAPLILVGLDTKRKMEMAGLRGLYYRPAEGLQY